MVSKTEPSFDIFRALTNWAEAYPNKEERIQVLRRELRKCRSGGAVEDIVRGQKRPRAYPATERNLEKMLEILGSEVIR